MKFSEFLEKEGVLAQIIDIVSKEEPNSDLYYVEDNGDTLDALFIFSNTEEGYEYWDDIHNRSLKEVTQWDMFFDFNKE